MICLGIDLGTQSLKVLIYDSLAHRTLAAQSQPLELISGDGGVREQKAQWWINALCACMERIDPDLRSSVQVVSVSAHEKAAVVHVVAKLVKERLVTASESLNAQFACRLRHYCKNSSG